MPVNPFNEATVEAKQGKPLVQRRTKMFPNEPPKPGATVTIDDFGAECKTPKDDGFIQALKEMVPYNQREWVPAQTCWWVGPSYSEKVLGLVKLFFRNVEVIDYRTD